MLILDFIEFTVVYIYRYITNTELDGYYILELQIN